MYNLCAPRFAYTQSRDLATTAPQSDIFYIDVDNRVEEEYEIISGVTLPPTLTETVTMTGMILLQRCICSFFDFSHEWLMSFIFKHCGHKL